MKIDNHLVFNYLGYLLCVGVMAGMAHWWWGPLGTFHSNLAAVGSVALFEIWVGLWRVRWMYKHRDSESEKGG